MIVHTKLEMTQMEKRFVNSARHSARVAAKAERLLRQAPVKPGMRYLDVGCGNGAAAAHVAERLGLVVIGVDVDPDQIALATERQGSNVQFLTADATRLPFEDGSFDVVATSKTTHHIPNWRNAVAEMARVVRPGGRLLYSDLVLPRLVAARFPSRPEVEEVARSSQLRAVSATRRVFSVELVFERLLTNHL